MSKNLTKRLEAAYNALDVLAGRFDQLAREVQFEADKDIDLQCLADKLSEITDVSIGLETELSTLLP